MPGSPYLVAVGVDEDGGSSLTKQFVLKRPLVRELLRFSKPIQRPLYVYVEVLGVSDCVSFQEDIHQGVNSRQLKERGFSRNEQGCLSVATDKTFGYM